MKFLQSQIEVAKNAIDEDIVAKNDSIISEQKEKIIEMIFEMHNGIKGGPSKSKIGAIIDKLFADVLDID